ncbi:MAG: hypothetical protein WB919_16150 [Candidatus Sulfotelmatobacter sp.]
MLVEVAKPVTLISCILSLYAVFSAAFLTPASDMHQRICDALIMLALAAGIALIGGLIFRSEMQEPRTQTMRLTATLPVQLFCWASATMLVLFIVSWYLESYCVFYRDVRF